MHDWSLSPSILPAQFRREADGRMVEAMPATPCPDLLTEDEAIRYLRLDAIDIENPEATLRRYRKLGLIRGTQVGKCVRYRRKELERFLDRITDSKPIRNPAMTCFPARLERTSASRPKSLRSW